MNLEAEKFIRRLSQMERKCRGFIDRSIPRRHRILIEADDVWNAVCADLWAGRDRLESLDENHFSKYVWMATKHVMRDEIARLDAQKRRPPGSRFDTLSHVAVHETPSRAVVQREDESRVRRAIEALPSKHRQIMRMRLLEGCDVPEIIEATNRKTESVWYYLRTGAEKMSAMLRQ